MATKKRTKITGKVAQDGSRSFNAPTKQSVAKKRRKRRDQNGVGNKGKLL